MACGCRKEFYAKKVIVYLNSKDREMFSMIALALLALYVSLFVLAAKNTAGWVWRILTWFVLASPMVWLAWDIPVGEYKFRQLCNKEAGFKLYVKNPTPAKIIRLNEDSDLGAKEFLRKYPSLDAIEARDKKWSYLSGPHVYAIYSIDRDNGNILSKLLDEVKETKVSAGVVVRSAPSSADYVLSEKTQDASYRIDRYDYILSARDGSVVATTTKFSYAWSKAENTILGRAFNIKECGELSATRLVEMVVKKSIEGVK